MEIALPNWVASNWGMDGEFGDLDSLRSALEVNWRREMFYALDVETIVGAIQAPPLEEVRFVGCSTPEVSWRFAEVSLGGESCELTEIGAQMDQGVPTRALQLLLRVWLAREDLSPEVIVRDRQKNLLVAWNTRPVKYPELLVVGLAGIESECAISEPDLSLRAASGIAVAQSSRIVNGGPVYAELLQAVIRNKIPSLRFLHIYRLFERAYLSDALRKLNDSFLFDPKSALRKAELTLGSELSSLVSLVEGTSAEAGFEEVCELFEANTSNRFLIAIMRRARLDNALDYRESWKRGCALAYKVRCAIVHSGESGPILESFNDSESGCSQLNGPLWVAAMACLGISAT